MIAEAWRARFLAELERQAPGSEISEDWEPYPGEYEIVVDLPNGAWVYLTLDSGGYAIHSSEPSAGVASEPEYLTDQDSGSDLPAVLAEALAYVEPFED